MANYSYLPNTPIGAMPGAINVGNTRPVVSQAISSQEMVVRYDNDPGRVTLESTDYYSSDAVAGMVNTVAKQSESRSVMSTIGWVAGGLAVGFIIGKIL